MENDLSKIELRVIARMLDIKADEVRDDVDPLDEERKRYALYFQLAGKIWRMYDKVRETEREDF